MVKKKYYKRDLYAFFAIFWGFRPAVAFPFPHLSTYQSDVYGKAVDATNFLFGLKGFYFLGE